MTPPTIRDLLRAGEAHLRRNDVPNARRNAEWILCRSLSCTPLYLHVHSADAPDDENVSDYRDRIERRGNREPLQYVIETAQFMSLEFEMSPGVFVPRPETETLAELSLAMLSRAESTRESSVKSPARVEHVLDLCCGSGIVGVSIGYYRPSARVYAVDVNPNAVTLSRRNAVRAGVGGRFAACCCEATVALEGAHGADWPDEFHLIACNPPYIASGVIHALPPEVRDWDPQESLDGGTDGLGFYRRVAPVVGRRLAPGGVILLEIGSDQGESVRHILESVGFEAVRVHPDTAGRDRVVTARRDTR